MSLVYEGARWKIERFISGFANNAYLITADSGPVQRNHRYARPAARTDRGRPPDDGQGLCS